MRFHPEFRTEIDAPGLEKHVIFGMPSKAAQLIAFFAVLLVSAALHRYVYANLKRVLLRDYPRWGIRLVRTMMVLFIVMDSPFLFLFLRPRIHADLTMLTRVLLYPFSVWQAIMILWAIILFPMSLVR